MAFKRNAAYAGIVCRMIADGSTLRQVAREVGLKSASSITDWAREDEAFAAHYARAKEAQADHFAEEIVEISDNGSNDWMEREGLTIADHEHIQRSKLRVDARKWLMAKMAPKRYGERIGIEHSGEIGFAERLVRARERRSGS